MQLDPEKHWWLNLPVNHPCSVLRGSYGDITSESLGSQNSSRQISGGQLRFWMSRVHRAGEQSNAPMLKWDRSLETVGSPFCGGQSQLPPLDGETDSGERPFWLMPWWVGSSRHRRRLWSRDESFSMTDVLGKWKFPEETGDSLRVERVGVDVEHKEGPGRWDLEARHV